LKAKALGIGLVDAYRLTTRMPGRARYGPRNRDARGRYLSKSSSDSTTQEIRSGDTRSNEAEQERTKNEMADVSAGRTHRGNPG